MSTNGTTPLLLRRFRASDSYELVPFRRLAEAERAMFADLAEHADHVGILRPPRGSALGVKNATRSIAALTRYLRKPAPLPERLRASVAPHMERQMAALVLDGVLEVEDDGEFLSGADACDLLLDSTIPSLVSDDPIAQVSYRALRYAAALEIDDASALSARLYFYNRQPTTPIWAHRLTSESAVDRFLGVDPDSSLALIMQRFWNRAPSKDLPGWINWSSRFRYEKRSVLSPTYKLYISPAIEAVPDALQAAVPVLAEHNAPDFKIGSDLFGLVRPDKIVVYLDSMESLSELAEALKRALGRLAGHGVPFTASLFGDSVLSWGMDPPRALKLLQWRETESWRLWVTNRLALYLLTARAASSCALDPWHYALVRLRFEGVDISTWTPSQSLWSSDDGSSRGNH
jgi:hypothetical protein